MELKNPCKEASVLIKYPLADIYSACVDYTESLKWNWDWVSPDAEIDHTIIDVSDAVKVFKHLSLDKDYSLYYYDAKRMAFPSARGKCVAIKHEDSLTEGMKTGFLGLMELPDAGVPPMDAVYHDGTPEGYLESVLLSELIDHIPKRKTGEIERIIDYRPSNLDEHWNEYLYIPDWSIRLDLAHHRLVFFTHIKGHYFGDAVKYAKDSFYLRHCKFRKHETIYSPVCKSGSFQKYKSSISDIKRFDEVHHSCLFDTRTILIAEERSNT